MISLIHLISTYGRYTLEGQTGPTPLPGKSPDKTTVHSTRTSDSPSP